MLNSADKAASLDRCTSTIKELEIYLARGGPERLEAHRKIGDQLLDAKEIDSKTFVSWCNETFGHAREWRTTHMNLARRWDDVMAARAWAEREHSKLASSYSVDGAKELLQAWGVAMGHENPKPKRSLPKKAKTSDEDDFGLQQSPEQAEIAVLRQQLQQQSDEAAYFRIELPLDIRSEARTLAVRVSAHDDEAERELRAIACDYRWLFHDLCNDLGHKKSGSADFLTEHLSLETPIADEGSAAIAITETSVDAPTAEEATSEETSAERAEGDSLASTNPAATLDNSVNATRLEYEPSPGDEGVHGAKPEKAAPPMTGDPPTKRVIVETRRRRSRGKKRPHVDAWWKREPDRPSPSARDVGEMPR
jgi:hypothetical protein